MGWQIWKKKGALTATSGEKPVKREKPKELPNEIGRHLVVNQNLDPDWVWRLKYVRQVVENSKSLFDIRIYDPETAQQKGVSITDYAALEDHMDLVIYAGRFDKESRKFQLEELIKKAS